MLKELVKLAVREVVEGDMSEVQEPDWASATRAARGYRSGYDERGFVVLLETRIELRLPQDREGRFSAEPFERYQRSEKALVAGMEMYVPGVSTPKVTNATEQLCGASSATA